MTYREFVCDLAARDDSAFAEYVSGLRFPAHLREAYAFASANPRAIMLMPRGHGKTIGAIHHLARRIGESAGRLKIGVVTATEIGALQRSGTIRSMVESDSFAEIFPWAAGGVVSRKWTEAVWTVKGAEGYAEKDATVTAGSLYGLRPGPRFDLLLADDLIGRDECATAAQRQKASDRFWSVIDPMLTPTGQVIVLGTRWHEDDLYAELMRKGWPAHVRQALAEDGTALWPDYWTAERLAAKRLGMGSAWFDLQYQNDPSGMGGNIFKREFYRYVDRVPAGARRVGLDLALGTSQRSDYTAAVEVLEDAECNLYVVGAWRERLEDGIRQWLTGVDDAGAPILTGPALTGPRLLWNLDMLPPDFVGCYQQFPATRRLAALNIESVAYQAAFTQEMLRYTRLAAHPCYPDSDKVTRARAVAIRYEAGKVYHLRGAPGIQMLEDEQIAFPNDEHDDLVDALGYAADVGGNEFSFTSARW
jgi:predicted phage terminase large subunit-like protein